MSAARTCQAASVFMCAMLLGATAEASTLFVQAGSGGTCTEGWSNACGDLQAALLLAMPGDEIWVASGVYKPGTTRDSTFNLKPGVAMYGGFAGTESSLAGRQPDAKTNGTVLSGDIGIENETHDNVLHVVTSGPGITSTTIVDGFTIRDGNADGSPSNQNGCGGGMYARQGSPTLSNLLFAANRAGLGGAAGLYVSACDMYGNYCQSITPTLTRVTFQDNITFDSDGGGMYVGASGSVAVLSDVHFVGNHARSGAGIVVDEANVTITDATFEANTAVSGGGGILAIFSATLTLNRVQLRVNTAQIGGGLNCSADTSCTVSNAVFSGNQAVEYGGGIASVVGYLSLTNAVLSGNVANLGGGISAHQPRGIATLVNVTMNGNQATHPFGGGAIGLVDNPAVAVVNSIVNPRRAPSGSVQPAANSA